MNRASDEKCRCNRREESSLSGDPCLFVSLSRFFVQVWFPIDAARFHVKRDYFRFRVRVDVARSLVKYAKNHRVRGGDLQWRWRREDGVIESAPIEARTDPLSDSAEHAAVKCALAGPRATSAILCEYKYARLCSAKWYRGVFARRDTRVSPLWSYACSSLLLRGITQSWRWNECDWASHNVHARL